MNFVNAIADALLMAFAMFWKTGWSLVLGFGISAILETLISKEKMQAALGRDGSREIALATLFGAASSSCSYASAAISRIAKFSTDGQGRRPPGNDGD
jgi:uncharacterized membrane protein YraQ (UPF0718 family)